MSSMVNGTTPSHRTKEYCSSYFLTVPYRATHRRAGRDKTAVYLWLFNIEHVLNPVLCFRRQVLFQRPAQPPESADSVRLCKRQVWDADGRVEGNLLRSRGPRRE